MEKEKFGFGSGVVIFFLGIILLLFTFYVVYSVFTNPEALSGFQALAPQVGGELGQVIGPVVNVMTYLVAALLLWVMGSISGRITKYGISMYKTSKEEEKTS
ncbi:hypothetical protein C9439_05430 [archaeon SCG-AAA382B04]|nr:hypothetical protein C9439_05430 [archaeon SCG-AAA382B04]